MPENSTDWTYGTPGDEVIIGTDDADLINGECGDDIIYGGGGADWLLGSYGDDRIDGEWGPDVIDGYDGEDWIDGSAGDDDLYGSDQDDSLFGGRGNDEIYGGDDNDDIYGEFDSDDIDCGAGTDDYADVGVGVDDPPVGLRGLGRSLVGLRSIARWPAPTACLSVGEATPRCSAPPAHDRPWAVSRRQRRSSDVTLLLRPRRPRRGPLLRARLFVETLYGHQRVDVERGGRHGAGPVDGGEPERWLRSPWNPCAACRRRRSRRPSWA